MSSDKYNVNNIASTLQTYSPFDLTELDGEYVVRIALFKGTFPWHVHERDEFFLTLKGSFILEMKNSRIVLNEGECFNVKSGIEHRPSSEKEAIVFLAMHKKDKNVNS